MQIARTALQSTVLMLLAAGVGAPARAAQADTALRDAATKAQPAVIETCSGATAPP